MAHYHVWRITLDGKGRNLPGPLYQYGMNTIWSTERAAMLDKERFEREAGYDPKSVQYDVRPCDDHVKQGVCYAITKIS